MKFVVPFVAAAAVAGSASATFLGFTTANVINGSKVETYVYANFDAASNTLLNAFGYTTLGPAVVFTHSDFVGGSFAPQFISGPASGDSFVTIGETFGFSSSTSADPAWGGPGFNQPSIPNTAGWFNSNPPNLQGQAGLDLKTTVAHFVTDLGSITDIFLKVGYNDGLGTPTVFGEGVFIIGIPAPGAIALLGFAGLASRRRRA